MDTMTSKVLAPEDISSGDFVTPLTVIYEFIDYTRECRAGPPELCRVPMLPCPITPYRVVGVCLPFVLVEDACGGTELMDVRRSQLARLDEEFGEAAMKCARKAEKG